MNIREKAAMTAIAGQVPKWTGVPWTAAGVAAISEALNLANPEDPEHVGIIVEAMAALDAFAELLRRKS